LIGKATRLYPLPPREVPAGEIYADLRLPPSGPGRRDPSRPYVIVNMVSSIDGKATVGGRTAGLGDEADRQTMRNLRSKADAVMVGAGTLRSERISLGLDEPADGPQPLAVVATKTGDVPLESNLILHESQEVLLLSPENLHVPREESVRWMRVPGDPSGNMDLREALKGLKGEHAVDLLLVEGGPTLNHALASRGLADELFLTLAPKLLGGEGCDSLTVLDGSPLSPEASSPKLLSGHLTGDELFLRYGLHPASYFV
jgi:2,5-diamino-6-(ribosylamino)-4(3H)-pyrimidinone 5'-phosphate reductase